MFSEPRKSTSPPDPFGEVGAYPIDPARFNGSATALSTKAPRREASSLNRVNAAAVIALEKVHERPGSRIFGRFLKFVLLWPDHHS